MSEIIFEVREDEADGGYTASALGYGTTGVPHAWVVHTAWITPLRTCC